MLNDDIHKRIAMCSREIHGQVLPIINTSQSRVIGNVLFLLYLLRNAYITHFSQQKLQPAQTIVKHIEIC
jgi:hypothetical protein